MDSRKIEFLIAMQREIDKLEAQEGESTRVERLKSRFYNVVEVAKIAQSSQTSSTTEIGDTTQIRPATLTPALGGHVILADLFSNGEEVDEHMQVPTSVDATEIVKRPFPLQDTSNDQNKLFHHPRTAKERLSFFSTDDIYKQFTHHVPDDVFSFEQLTKNVNWSKDFAGEFNELNSASAYRLLHFMKTPIITENQKPFYAGNERGFWTYGYVIPVGWGSPEVASWCRENSNRYPSAMPILKEKQKPSKHELRIRYRTFGDIIKRFKHDIEQRTDDPAQTFDRLLRNSLAEVDLNKDLTLNMNDEDFKTVAFYADLVQIKKALRYVFIWILHAKYQSNQIHITMKDNEEKYELSIFHIEGSINKSKQGNKINGTGGDTYTVRGTLRSVCDWTAIYSFGDRTSMAFEYLTDGCNVREPVEGIEVPFEAGITHKLSFYK